jgi:two-component system, NtrC family, response regulator
MKWAFDGYDIALAADCEEAVVQLRRVEPAVVTLDLGLPPRPNDPSEGLRTLRTLLDMAPETKVIVLTGQNDRANALQAIAAGAYDFYAKPFEPDVLALIIERAFKLHELEAENRRLVAAQPPTALGSVITRDPGMLRACRAVEKVATSNATVLILGESGTGKELLARGVHEASARKEQRFVAINCAAIPDTLLESELFGYEKGAFTGATKQTLGRIESANKGTLFLDEIGDLPHSLQAKLLRFLQERSIERLGGRQEIPVDVRVVCATHQDLKRLIGEGRFREDLYYRLAEILIDVPPLRSRPGDAVMLARAFAARVAMDQKRRVPTLSPDAVASIEQHQWPGNVRELENVMKRAVIMSDAAVVRADDLGLAAASEGDDAYNLRAVRDEAERRAVVRALGRSDDNLSRASELLGISRPTLYDLMHKFGLK